MRANQPTRRPVGTNPTSGFFPRFVSCAGAGRRVGGGSFRRFPLSVLLAGLLNGLPSAQSQHRPPNELDPLPLGVVLDVPATRLVKQRADVVYLRRGARSFALDIYQPPDLKPTQLRPAVVFLNAVGDRGDNRLRRWGIYSSWPRLIAAHGLCGVSMDADPVAIQDCLAGVFQFLAEHGKEHGIDADRLGVYAASANVTGATEYSRLRSGSTS